MESLLSRFTAPQVVVGNQDTLILNPNGTLTYHLLSTLSEWYNPLPSNIKLDLPITSITKINNLYYLITCDGQLYVYTNGTGPDLVRLDAPVVKVVGRDINLAVVCLTVDGRVFVIRERMVDLASGRLVLYQPLDFPLVKLDLPVLDIVGDFGPIACLLQDRSLVWGRVTSSLRADLVVPEWRRLPMDGSLTPSSLHWYGLNLIVAVREKGSLVIYKSNREYQSETLKLPCEVSRVVTRTNALAGTDPVLLISSEGRVYASNGTLEEGFTLVELPFRVANVFLGVKGHRVYVTEEGRLYWSEGYADPLPL